MSVMWFQRRVVFVVFFFFFKQKTAYEMRISDWSSDVCSSDLVEYQQGLRIARMEQEVPADTDASIHAMVAAGLGSIGTLLERFHILSHTASTDRKSVV